MQLDHVRHGYEGCDSKSDPFCRCLQTFDDYKGGLIVDGATPALQAAQNSAESGEDSPNAGLINDLKSLGVELMPPSTRYVCCGNHGSWKMVKWTKHVVFPGEFHATKIKFKSWEKFGSYIV